MGNRNLESIPGLANLRKVYGALLFQNNGANFDYSGLENLLCHGGVYHNDRGQYCPGCPERLLNLAPCTQTCRQTFC